MLQKNLIAVISCVVLCTVGTCDKYREVTADAEDDVFSFASYYQDKMVLQREPHRSIIWGYGNIGATVVLSMEQFFYSTNVKVGASGKGVWYITLFSQKPGGPHLIKAGQNFHGAISEITLSDVLFGDVWLCSGQSNMQFAVKQSFNATQEINRASNYPHIRLMMPSEKLSGVPLLDLLHIRKPWSVASNTSVDDFSAVCWFYGSLLYDQLKVPIGLIGSYWGGTPVEAWSSPRALKECGLNERSLQASQRAIKEESLELFFSDNQNNSVLWNAMIHPFLNMSLKGVLWYQGENNAKYHSDQYSCSFPAMIRDWRRSWFEGTIGQTEAEFPFGFVQLGTETGLGVRSFFRMIRWHQTADHGYVPNQDMPKTFMAVAMDLPDNESPYGPVHYRDKQDVGKRLGMASLNTVYGLDFSASGPIIKSAVQSDDRHVIVNYPIGEKLLVKERGNFAVCCNFTKCNISEPSPSLNWPWARIESSTSYTITLDVQPCVKGGGHASMIRYAWAEEPCLFKDCSVYNQAGLPAPPFVISVTSK